MLGERLYYHVAKPLYDPGDKILPGMWGRLVRADGGEHPLFYREMFWEAMRRKVAPPAPSRLEAAFAFESRPYAEAWRADVRPGERLYAIRLDGVSPTLRTEIENWNRARQAHSFAEVQRLAELYWRGGIADPECVEILTLGPLEVVERLA